MSANQSNLSDAHYGYDFVVSTTQASVNATMKEYLYNTVFPEVKMYWNQDENGNPVAIAYEDLMKQTNNTDPLNVANWKTGDPQNADITNINNSNFYFAFKAAIGVPPDMDPTKIPDIVTLQTDSESVTFSLICEEFTVVTCNFGRHGLTSFFSASQPSDTPWLFTSTVALKNILNNSNLPPDVQKQLNNLGPDAFSVQQLMFDLDNAALESTPNISGIDSGTPAYTLLSQVFLGAYYKAMKTNAQPVLNYAIMKNQPDLKSSTLTLTNLSIEVSPYKDPANNVADNNNLNTLNYLCEVNGSTLPPAVPFSWNWVEKSEVAVINGAIAINRNTFATYFKNQLLNYVSNNCFAAWVRVTIFGVFDADIKYEFNLTPGQTPVVTMPTSGAEILTFSYSSSSYDQGGAGGDMGGMTLSSSTTATVTFTGSTMVIVQNLTVTIDVRRYQSSLTWNPVKKTFTDTYTLATDEFGGLTASFNSVPEDHSDPTPSANWFIELFTDLDEIAAQVDSWAKNFLATAFHDIPLNVAQRFVFPGGKTFTFKDVDFSQNQDLISHISYVQP